MIQLFENINEVEYLKGLVRPDFISFSRPRLASEGRPGEKEHEDSDRLLRLLSTTQVEISLGIGILDSSLRLGVFCREAVTVVYRAGEETGIFIGGGLRLGEREMVLGRIRGVISRCQSVRERFAEMGDRAMAHVGQVSEVERRLRRYFRR